MQGLTAPPRENLTATQVRDLLVGQGVRRGFGLELLDGSNVVVEDISADCRGFTVTRDNTAEVHGRLRATLAREVAWGQARVRPYRTLNKGGVSARFNRGVFVLTTPDTDLGRLPILYGVSGQDLIQRLTREVGDTYVVAAGVTYVQALKDVLAASGLGGTLLIDGTRQDTAIPATMVWALSGAPRWLDVCNDLLRAIAYEDLWCDQDGAFRSGPVQPLDTAPVEWTFDTSDRATDLLAADRSESFDAWNAPNRWRFVRSRMTVQPTTSDGIYVVSNQSDGESSIDSVGVVPVTHYLDVADQAMLVAEGDRIVEVDRRAERRVTLSVDPLPIAGHRDVVQLIDGGTSRKFRVSSWEESTSGRGTWVLGGGTGAEPQKPAEQQAAATVTAAAPLRVVVDGATVDSFANALDAATYSVGQRVTVTVRNPAPPLIQGVES